MSVLVKILKSVKRKYKIPHTYFFICFLNNIFEERKFRKNIVKTENVLKFSFIWNKNDPLRSSNLFHYSKFTNTKCSEQ